MFSKDPNLDPCYYLCYIYIINDLPDRIADGGFWLIMDDVATWNMAMTERRSFVPKKAPVIGELELREWNTVECIFLRPAFSSFTNAGS